MKRTSKILAITLTLIVLASLFAFAAPVSATVSSATVTVAPNSISSEAQYIIKFDTIFPLALAADTITIVFPSDTAIDAGMAIGDVDVSKDGGTTYVAAAVVAATAATRTVVVNPSAAANWTAGPAHIAVRIKVNAGAVNPVVNPTAPGSYVLNVKTSQETTAVDSAAYTISIPGKVDRYNKAGNYIATYNTLTLAMAAALDDDTLRIGPGTYTEAAATTTGAGQDRVSIVPTGSNADTIIEGNITFAAGDTFWKLDNVTVKGTIVNNAASTTITKVLLSKAASGAVAGLFTNTGATLALSDSTIDTTRGDAADVGFVMGGGTATLTSNTFKLNASSALADDIGVSVTAASTLTVDKGIFTGASGVGVSDVLGAVVTATTVKNSTFTSLAKAVDYNNGGATSTLTVQGNTIDTATKSTVGAIEIGATIAGNSVVIESNVITNGVGYSVNITALLGAVRAVGNQFSGNVKGFSGTIGVGGAINAVLNWWGSASGPTTATVSGGDKVAGAAMTAATYTPFLTAKTTTARTAASTGVLQNIDMSTTAGVAITNATIAAGNVIAGQKLAENPKTVAPAYTAMQYFDVYTSAASASNMQLKLYATGIKSNTIAYVWNATTNTWVQASSQGVAGTGDYVWVNINTAGAAVATIPNTGDMSGTPFVLVSGPEPAPAAFAVTAPAAGATVGLTNIPLTWAPVVGATSYKVVVSTKADLSSPVVDAPATSAGYIVTATLTDATAYLWQITALSGETVIGKSAVGSFVASKAGAAAAAPNITVNVPTQAAPVINIPTQPAPVISIPAQPTPNITVNVPAPTQAAAADVTPAWIYAIIAIGAILVIAVLVLIVRTRRAV